MARTSGRRLISRPGRVDAGRRTAPPSTIVLPRAPSVDEVRCRSRSRRGRACSSSPVGGRHCDDSPPRPPSSSPCSPALQSPPTPSSFSDAGRRSASPRLRASSRRQHQAVPWWSRRAQAEARRRTRSMMRRGCTPLERPSAREDVVDRQCREVPPVDPGHRWWSGGEAVAGRGGGLHGPVRAGSGPPAGGVLGVVAGLAQALRVAPAGGSVVGVASYVVERVGSVRRTTACGRPGRAAGRSGPGCRGSDVRGRPSRPARRWSGWCRAGAATPPRPARRRRPRSRGPARPGWGRSRRGGRRRRLRRTARRRS